MKRSMPYSLKREVKLLAPGSKGLAALFQSRHADDAGAGVLLWRPGRTQERAGQDDPKLRL